MSTIAPICNPKSHRMVKADCLRLSDRMFIDTCDDQESSRSSKRFTADYKWTRPHTDTLKQFLNDLALDDKGSVVGVRWSLLPVTNVSQSLQNILDIEKLASRNLKNFKIAASDYMLGVFSNEVYNTTLKIGDLVTCSSFDFNGYCEKNWVIYDVVNNISNGYGGAIFENKNDQLLVVAHRGTHTLRQWYTDIKLILQSDPTDPIFWPEFIDAYNLAKKAYDYAYEQGYHMSMTGHSLGGIYAEVIAYYIHNTKFIENYDHARILTKTVVFDSPGAQDIISRLDSKFNGFTATGEISNLGLKNYVLAPNLVNTYGSHTGVIFISRNFEDYICKSKIDIVDKTCATYYSHGIKNIVSKYFDLTSGKTKYEELVRVVKWPIQGSPLSVFGNSTAVDLNELVDIKHSQAQIKGATLVDSKVEDPQYDNFYDDSKFERWSVDPYLKQFLSKKDICGQLAYRMLREICFQIEEGIRLSGQNKDSQIIEVVKGGVFESVDQARDTFVKLLTFSSNFKNIINKSIFSHIEFQRIVDSLKRFNKSVKNEKLFVSADDGEFITSLGEYYNNPDPDFNNDYQTRLGFVCGERGCGKTEFLSSVAGKLENLRWPKFWVMDGDLELGALNLLDHIEVLSDSWTHNANTLQASIMTMLDQYKVNFRRILLIVEDFDRNDLQNYSNLLFEFIEYGARIIFSSNDCTLSADIESILKKRFVNKSFSFGQVKLKPISRELASSVLDEKVKVNLSSEQREKLLDLLGNKSQEIIPIRLSKLINLINGHGGYTITEIINNYHQLASEGLAKSPEIEMMLKVLETQNNAAELKTFLVQLYLIANPIKEYDFDRGKFFSAEFLNALNLQHFDAVKQEAYNLVGIYKQLRDLSIIEDDEDAFTNGITIHSSVMNEIRWFLLPNLEGQISGSLHNYIFQRILLLFQEWDDFSFGGYIQLLVPYAIIKDYIKALTEYALAGNDTGLNVVELAKVCKNLSTYTQYNALKDSAVHALNSIALLKVMPAYSEAEGGYVMAKCLMQLARIYYLMYDFEKAKNSYKEAHKLLIAAGNESEAQYLEVLLYQIEQKTQFVDSSDESYQELQRLEDEYGDNFYKSVAYGLKNEGTETIKKDVVALIAFIDSLTVLHEFRYTKFRNFFDKEGDLYKSKSDLRDSAMKADPIIKKLMMYADYFESFAAPITQQIFYTLARYQFYMGEYNRALEFAEKSYINAESQDSYSIDYLDLIVLMQRIFFKLDNTDRFFEFSKEALDIVKDVGQAEIGIEIKKYFASLLYSVFENVHKVTTNKIRFDDMIYENKVAQQNGFEVFIQQHAELSFELLVTIKTLYESVRSSEGSLESIGLQNEYIFTLYPLAKTRFLLSPLKSSDENYSKTIIIQDYANLTKLICEHTVKYLFSDAQYVEIEDKYNAVMALTVKYYSAFSDDFLVKAKPSIEGLNSFCANANRIMEYALNENSSLTFEARVEQLNELGALFLCNSIVDRYGYKSRIYEVAADSCTDETKMCLRVKHQLYYSALALYEDDFTKAPMGLKIKFISFTFKLCNNLSNNFEQAMCKKFSGDFVNKLGVDLEVEFQNSPDIISTFSGDGPLIEMWKVNDNYKDMIERVDSCIPLNQESLSRPDYCNPELIKGYAIDLATHYI